ncbi:MAG: NAD-dependent epimerase/dehydratase family protein [Chitinophagaceae bacterium]|nr:MAG: NAD-dependent epimerase/dehydratase family protein [Chitinophagaceae bacterium]
MKEIIITGASGFVGKNLVEYLRELNCLPVGISLRSGKIPDLPGSAEALVHLAGKAHDVKGVEDAEIYFAVNTDLTIRLFDEFLNSTIPVFIFLSSVKASADSVNGLLTEEDQPYPVTAYGQSKWEAERYILNRNIPSDKRIFILRPCMIHGPGNKGNLNLLYKIVKWGIPYPLASFENQRSFLSVENLCFVIKELIDRTDIPSGVYNVSDDSALSTNRVIEIMYETIMKRPRLLKINKRFINSTARIGDFLPLPLNSERLQKLTESYVVSNAKLIDAIKKPLPVGSEEGLRKTIYSFCGGK